MPRVLLSGLFAALTLAAQLPQKVVFQCTEADLMTNGLTCSEVEPCAIMLELSSIDSIGQKLFLIGNIHTTAATLTTILLSSVDGGKTWIEPFERLRDATFDRLMFTDFENGWISGQFLHPVPRDPFILRTTDAGQTWRKASVFGEPRPGTILDMNFESKASGAMVIDRGQSSDGARYEKYESMTGGDSWMLREVADKPLKLKRFSGDSASPWRLRADGKTKAYAVERREGAKWVAVSSFLIDLDPCKPAVKLTPEPATQEPEPSGTLVIGTPEKKKKP